MRALSPNLAPAAPSAVPRELDAGAIEATVFGLDVRGEPSLSFLQHARASPTGRLLTVHTSSLRAPPPPSPRGEHARQSAPGRTVCLQRGLDGAARFCIQTHPLAGYLMWSRDHGSYLLSSDARRLCCAPAGAPAHIWQRFLVGQVLPFATLVAGLEIFHASAVVLGQRAIGLIGPAGAGKTSVALELCRRGAGFFADDVLALEASAGELIAQPGAPVAGVDRDTLERLRGWNGSPPVQLPWTTGYKPLLRMDGARRPVPLGALFFLDRRSDRDGEADFRPAADARMLLASTFNFVLDSPRRMRGLLEVCALAARTPVERIVIPASLDAGAVAQAVLSRWSAAG